MNIFAGEATETEAGEVLPEIGRSAENSGTVEGRGPPVTDTNVGGRASRDPKERRRALRKSEMVNEFRDKVNWHRYYQEIMNAEYNPEYFDDGAIAFMDLDGVLLTMEMQRNGEWSVINVEGIDYGSAKQPGKAHFGKDGSAQLSGERNDNGNVGDAKSSGQSSGAQRGGDTAGRKVDGQGNDKGDAKVSAAPSLIDPTRDYLEKSAAAKRLQELNKKRSKGKLTESERRERADIKKKYHFSLELDVEQDGKVRSLTEEQRAAVSATQEAVRAAVREELDRMGREYGWIKAGESPARAVQIPQKTADDKKVSQTVRTVLEAKATPEDAIPSIEEMVANGDFSYEVYSDKRAIAEAAAAIEDEGWDLSLRDWFKAVESGEISKKNTAMGWALYNNAANCGNVQTAMDILNAMVEHQRSAAQALQATRILKKLSPEMQLYGAQRSVKRLQEDLNERFGEKDGITLRIDPTLAEELLTAEDQKGRDEALKKIYRDVGRQMPSRFRDKWNTWRYLAMLGNARTHVRNVMGNAGFAPVVAAKNLTATAIESAVSRVSGGKLERSKALVTGATKADRALLSAAWSDYAEVAEAALGGGKYGDLANANKYVEEGRVIFKSKVLEAARKDRSFVRTSLRDLLPHSFGPASLSQ